MRDMFVNYDNLRIECADYADFMGRLTAGSVDLVLTDPPYVISRETGFSNTKLRKYEKVTMDFGEWDKAEIDLSILAAESYRVLRDGGTVIIFYDVWKAGRLKEVLEQAGFGMIRLIIWQKTNPVPLNSKRTYLSNSREVAVVGVKGHNPTFNAEYHHGVFNYMIQRKNRIHPTQKSDKLFSELIKIHTNENDFVIDPFLGGAQRQRQHCI